MSETVQIELIRTLPAVIAALASIGCVFIQVIGQYKHRNHEATSDNTNEQITIFMNGGVKDLIEEEVRKHVGETLK